MRENQRVRKKRTRFFVNFLVKKVLVHGKLFSVKDCLQINVVFLLIFLGDMSNILLALKAKDC